MQWAKCATFKAHWGQAKQSQFWLFIISIMPLDAQQRGQQHLQVAILIDSNKDGLTVTVVTVTYHALYPGLPLSFNSGLMSDPSTGVRDDRDRRSQGVSRVKQTITGRQNKDHYRKLKSSQFQHRVQPQSILVTVAVSCTPSHSSIIFLLLAL